MKKPNSLYIPLILSSIVASSLLFIIYSIVTIFCKDCINASFIGWDPASRFQVSLSMADSWRTGNLLLPIWKLIDSPTWPSLRSLGESFGILVFGPNPVITVYINLIFLLSIFISFYIILFRISGNYISSILIGSILCLGILNIEPILLYSFSGMLEIMGGFFFIWVIYSINLFPKKRNYLPIFVFLLLQTKYPYAILFLFTFLFYLPILYGKEFFKFFHTVMTKLKEHSKRNPILSFAIVPITIYLFYKFKFIELNGKAPSLLLYSIFILFTLDSIRFLWKFKRILRYISFDLYYIFSYVFLPSLVWLVIHPDRFTATSKTIQHVQGEQSLFIYTKTLNQDIPYLWVILVIIVFISLTFYLLKKRNIKNSTFLEELSFFKKYNDWIPFVLLPIMTILGISLITPNQQERHIYHLYPSIILGLGIFFIQFIKLIANSEFKWLKLLSNATLALVYCLFLFYSYDLKWNVCYAGKKEDIRKHPLETSRLAKANSFRSTILINDIDTNHVNRADSELAVAIEFYKKNLPLYINPNPKNIKDQNHDIMRISFQCGRDKFKFYIAKYLDVDKNDLDSSEALKIQSLSYDTIGCMEIYSNR
jgi:hypothetical protein